MRIGLLSDTHGFLDEQVFAYFAECEEIWHAGDVGDVSVVERLREFRPLRGVFGNIDGADVRNELPESASFVVEGLSVFITHIGGYPGNYARGIKPLLQARRPGLFICGHSHVLKVMRDQALNLVHMNPGAAGRKGWHEIRTLLRFSIQDAKISGVEAIELGPRSALILPGASSRKAIP